MNRRVWIGIVAGVLAAFLLLGVGVGSFRAGQDSEVVTRAVGDGEVVRVIERGHGWGFFPGPFLFPLLLILVAVLLLRGRHHHGWHGRPGYGHGGGWGPGPWGGPGGPGGPGCGPDERMEEWHRRMHGETGPPAAGTATDTSDSASTSYRDGVPATRPEGYPGTGSAPTDGDPRDPSEPPGAGSPSPTA
jgi:hypothetical protein